ncbi:MAG: tetraacyldisaccharide 4'-kinase [Alphaproteobacteria bacterium]
MPLKTPSFWYRSGGTPSLREKILSPFSFLYRIGYEIHQHSITPETLDIPVICIGNINAGGTGKTPAAIALMDVIRKNNLAAKPFFLLRGYGGGERGPLLVDTSKHNSWSTGDEALILASRAPTVIAVDRVKGAQLAERHHADMVLMDDGLQNPGIHKNIKVVVINGDMGFGNGRMLPAGPLREPLHKGLARADLFILIGEDKRGVAASLPADKPLVRAHMEPDLPAPLPKDKKYIAFAGLGYPEKFFAFARDKLGLDIVKTISFPDHYPYSEADIANLRARALEWNAELLTTKKDLLRLPAAERETIHTADVRLAWEDEAALADFLKTRLSQ